MSKKKSVGLLAPVRRICMAFPEVTERASHGTPTWFVGGKSVFVQLWEAGHHQNTFPHLWCAAGPGVQEGLIAAAPERFFRPPYVGGKGWLGVRLDGEIDWAEIAELCEDAYRLIAPAPLVAILDARVKAGAPETTKTRRTRSGLTPANESPVRARAQRSGARTRNRNRG